MNNNRWHSILLSLGLVGVIVLISCSPGGQSGAVVPPEPAKIPRSDQPVPSVSKWDSLVPAAQKEGTVTYYMEGSQETRMAIAQEFHKKYGIKVEMVIGKGAELVAKIKTERQAGIYVADIAMTGETSAADLRKAGALTVLTPHIISPEALDPKVWPGGAPKMLDKQNTLVGLTYYYQPFILINTDLVKKGEISSHLDFLDPKWKGKITLYDPTVAGTGVYWIMYLMEVMGEPWSDKFFRELVKQDLVMTRDSRLHAESVARGKFPIGIAYSMSATGNLLKIGAPVTPFAMTEGGLVAAGAGSVSLVDKAPHPNAAALMVNWLLSQEGSRLFAEVSAYIPIRNDINPTWVHPALIPPKEIKLFWADADFITLLSEKGRDVARTYFGGLMK